MCAVRCEPLTLLNRHFSDSDGGADGTVGKLSAAAECHARATMLKGPYFLPGDFWLILKLERAQLENDTLNCLEFIL